MLDLRLIRRDPDTVRAALARRGDAGRLDEVLALDETCRGVRISVEEMRAESTRIAKGIGQAKKAGTAVDPAQEAEARRLRDETTAQEEVLRTAEADRDALLLQLPNLAEAEAPDGGEDDALELRRVGDIPSFPDGVLDHVTIAEGLGGLDLERAARTSGSRFAYLMGPLVRLQMSLVTYAVDLLEGEGFIPVIPPVLVREEALLGTGFFPTDRSAIYETASDDLFLVGTSEVPLAALHQDEILDEADLPLRYAGISTCFRREAGAAGRDTRGIFRVHQFDKVEMFTFTTPEQSAAEHQRILAIEERILNDLNIPYRVVDVAVGDLGASAARKFDCEAWMPGQDRYREVTSCSNCTDYQARRLRCRTKRGKETLPVHTLNGTAVAVGRTLIALLENHQRPDGSVGIPEVLQAFGAPPELKPR
ncbi:MAG: serine--tRNA ligase [Actinomycetota bacterium]|nr:serine--tRNA ligase [Actinomycetota bacterium]